jgi:hypothetical protein
MLIPRFWHRAESQAVKPDGQPVRFHVWRGSRGSEADARVLAEQAVQRVAERIRAGMGFPEKYTYADRPLREEVVREITGSGTADEPDAAITRNVYGALVLNAAHAFFIDVDVAGSEPRADSQTGSHSQPQNPAQALGEAAQSVWNVVDSLPLPGGLKSFLGAFRPSSPAPSTSQPPASTPTPASRPADAATGPALDRLRRFVASRPEWRVRVYRTYAGLRYLVTHAPFEPTSADVQQTLAALGADPQYIRLCQVQKSFRARLTPKPWRIGMPNPPVRFPFDAPGDERAMRDWETRYDAASAGRATCRFLEEIGTGAEHPAIAPLRSVHDELTYATSGLPLA